MNTTMNTMTNYEQMTQTGGVPVKMWTHGVPVEDEARRQLSQIARLPVVWPHVAAMPDVHVGIGATVGSVVPTRHAIIPAAVGVDIGCGMIAARTDIDAASLDRETLQLIRQRIHARIPVGRAHHERAQPLWDGAEIDTPVIARELKAAAKQIGTLGGGNHFVEVCIDEAQRVWIMLHSGSRGVGNRIGTHFIELAKKDMQKHVHNLPDKDLAYFTEGAEHFDDEPGNAENDSALQKSLLTHCCSLF